MNVAYWRVDEVQEILLPPVVIKQRGRLSFHGDASLPLNLKLVQNLLVLPGLCYGACFPTSERNSPDLFSSRPNDDADK